MPAVGFARTLGPTPLIMENAIKFLRIQNFKSIKDVTLRPRRVNLIIGEANVGKSNLLEAMSLLGAITYEQTEKFLGSFIRYEEPRQLFYNNVVANMIKLETDRDVAVLLFEDESNQFKYFLCNRNAYEELGKQIHSDISNSFAEEIEVIVMRNMPHEKINLQERYLPGINLIYSDFNKQGLFKTNGKSNLKRIWTDWHIHLPPKPYLFHKGASVNQDSSKKYLSPPSGTNLVEIIRTRPQLYQEIERIFTQYSQVLQLRGDINQLDVIKKVRGIPYSFPYSSVADTLQRIIFYLAAIESNDDAVLLFEEPEAHSFPVYVSKLGRRIVESTSNQFFIDTHSPYLVDGILEDMLTNDAQAGELAVFAAYYEDHQTKVHQLSDEEIRSIRNDSIDVFYNMKRFTTGRVDA